MGAVLRVSELSPSPQDAPSWLLRLGSSVVRSHHFRVLVKQSEWISWLPNAYLCSHRMRNCVDAEGDERATNYRQHLHFQGGNASSLAGVLHTTQQSLVICIGPLDSCMHHHCTSSGSDDVDGIHCYKCSVLLLSTDITVPNGLGLSASAW
jgi:hypothetical protein